MGAARACYLRSMEGDSLQYARIHPRRPAFLAVAWLLAGACVGDSEGSTVGLSATGTASTGAGPASATETSGATTQGTGTAGTASTTGTGGATGATEATDGTGGTNGCPGICFDVGVGTAGIDMGVPPPSCKVVDGMDAVGDCTDKAPPDAFEPETQWDFTGPAGFSWSIVTPLVANLTDDNDDGEIDLCDVPDVVVVAGPEVLSDTAPSRLYVLDGATGTPHFFAPQLVQFAATPAIGDIDGDLLPEIVTVGPAGAFQLVAFEHDGTVKWNSTFTWTSAQSSAVALADVDADGDVEIIAGTNLLDHEGNLVWSNPGDTTYSASTAADLDDDGQLEILTAAGVFRADGSTYFTYPGVSGWAHPQVADLDDDGLPEVLLSTNSGFMLFEHDGTLVYGPLAPTGATFDWNRPINVHNMDDDPSAEFGAADPSHYAIYDGDGSIVWQKDIIDTSGQAGGTAFDFIGKGSAQAIYADEQTVWVFDDMGNVLMSVPHLSGTVIEYPTVADIDNDGSAELLVVSNAMWWQGTPVPFTVRAIRDVQDRWVQARRIWNQHTYHVTNVREDGTIPQFEPKHWTLLNTFRTQAQIEDGGVCKPKPEG
ncbi:MAG: VCBS repeat-containing protein [Deltaproteobacteria bacterium]|nr:MAG: VCBS repeat-containing protein [Deltaproteobacteria bacterium]